MHDGSSSTGGSQLASAFKGSSSLRSDIVIAGKEDQGTMGKGKVLFNVDSEGQEPGTNEHDGIQGQGNGKRSTLRRVDTLALRQDLDKQSPEQTNTMEFKAGVSCSRLVATALIPCCILCDETEGALEAMHKDDDGNRFNEPLIGMENLTQYVDACRQANYVQYVWTIRCYHRELHQGINSTITCLPCLCTAMFVCARVLYTHVYKMLICLSQALNWMQKWVERFSRQSRPIMHSRKGCCDVSTPRRTFIRGRITKTVCYLHQNSSCRSILRSKTNGRIICSYNKVVVLVQFSVSHVQLFFLTASDDLNYAVILNACKS